MIYGVLSLLILPAWKQPLLYWVSDPFLKCWLVQTWMYSYIYIYTYNICIYIYEYIRVWTNQHFLYILYMIMRNSPLFCDMTVCNIYSAFKHVTESTTIFVRQAIDTCLAEMSSYKIRITAIHTRSFARRGWKRLWHSSPWLHGSMVARHVIALASKFTLLMISKITVSIGRVPSHSLSDIEYFCDHSVWCLLEISRAVVTCINWEQI